MSKPKKVQREAWSRYHNQVHHYRVNEPDGDPEPWNWNGGLETDSPHVEATKKSQEGGGVTTSWRT